MRSTLAIASKELRTYLASPMAYVVTALFLFMSGLFGFASDLTSTQLARLDGFFEFASFLLVLLAPILTMRLLAEEQKLGTLELLLTAPVRDHEVVLGKFLASVGILAAMLLTTFYYPVLLLFFAHPDIGPMLSGYFGLLLLGAALLAVGVLASSLTSNQIVAAVLGIGILLAFSFAHLILAFAQSVPGAADLLTYLSLSTHFTDFVRGVIDTKAVVYYLSFIAVTLFFTVRSLETRRWR